MIYPRAFVFVLLAALAVQSSGWLPEANAQRRAVLEVPVREFDFGTVPQGAKVVHEFELVNKGDAPLAIQRIVPSCGCTAAALTSMSIAPNAAEKLKVEFDTAGFSGPKTKTVQVLTSDVDLSTVVLTLRGTVVPSVKVEPQRLQFGVVSPGAPLEARQQEFVLSVEPGSDLEVSSVRSYAKFLSVKELEGTSGLERRYRVELDAMAPKGELRDRVIVEFRGGRQPSVNVPVTASVRGDLRLAPGTISFGILEGTQLIERRVRLDNQSPRPVSVLSLDSSHPAVSAQVLPGEQKGKTSLVVRVDPSKVQGDLKATLDVKTDHPVESTLILSVFGVQPHQ